MLQEFILQLTGNKSGSQTSKTSFLLKNYNPSYRYDNQIQGHEESKMPQKLGGPGSTYEMIISRIRWEETCLYAESQPLLWCRHRGKLYEEADGIWNNGRAWISRKREETQAYREIQSSR